MIFTAGQWKILFFERFTTNGVLHYQLWPNEGGYWLTFCTWLPYLMGWGNFLRFIFNNIKSKIAFLEKKLHGSQVQKVVSICGFLMIQYLHRLWNRSKKYYFSLASCDICFANCNTIWYYQSVFISPVQISVFDASCYEVLGLLTNIA